MYKFDFDTLKIQILPVFREFVQNKIAFLFRREQKRLKIEERSHPFFYSFFFQARPPGQIAGQRRTVESPLDLSRLVQSNDKLSIERRLSNLKF